MMHQSEFIIRNYNYLFCVLLITKDLEKVILQLLLFIYYYNFQLFWSNLIGIKITQQKFE